MYAARRGPVIAASAWSCTHEHTGTLRRPAPIPRRPADPREPSRIPVPRRSCARLLRSPFSGADRRVTEHPDWSGKTAPSRLPMYCASSPRSGWPCAIATSEDEDRFDQRSFCGQRVSADDLNYGRPRICPACLREQPVWWAVWDLGLVTACPIHRCLLTQPVPGLQEEAGLAASSRA